MKKKIFLIILVCIVAISLACAIYINIKLNTVANTSKQLIVKIENGMTTNEVIKTFNKQELLEPNLLFTLIAKYYSIALNKGIQAGIYRFEPHITNKEMLLSLFNGTNLYITRITFPEGIMLTRFASIVTRINIDSTKFMQLCYDTAFIHKLGIQQNSLEGYLMPATFDFFAETTAEEVITKLVKHQLKTIKKYSSQATKYNLNEHQMLTLASIIEAETPVIAERKIVSSVYHNRLKKGMLLQADPTVQYALGGIKRKLKYSDLQVDNKYNTYKYSGLPPGPICSPSSSSIEAAANPANTDYLFFVAKGDGSNQHNFATNFAEHQKNIHLFRKNTNK